jgi:hypothetical protein
MGPRGREGDFLEYVPFLSRYIDGTGAFAVPSVIAQWIVASAAAYAVAGLLFAAAFLTRGVGKVDPHAASAGVAVRLAWLPGTLALWPLLLNRWARGIPVPIERTAHRGGAPGAAPR